MTTTTARPTFADLAARDPRLKHLEREVRAFPRNLPGFCPNRVWYGGHLPTQGLKWRLSLIVGWYTTSPDPALATETAYEVAYEYLYDLLPNCQHEGAC